MDDIMHKLARHGEEVFGGLEGTLTTLLVGFHSA